MYFKTLAVLLSTALTIVGFYFFGFKFLSAILALALFVCCYYLYRFMNIILIFEDDLEITLETLKECEESLQNILSLRLFFDSEHVRPVVETAREEVQLCRVKVRQMAQRFVERSKQQYIIYEEPVEIQKTRGMPGSIDDDMMTNRILGFKQELGDDADVYFMSPDEMEAARRSRGMGR